MKINKKQLKKWISALDSGKYKQGFNKLNPDGTYCCLGVACKVLIPSSELYTFRSKNIIGIVPSDQPHSPKWLNNINRDFNNITKKSLTDLNDSEEYSFSEIATLLELVYIHKILD